MEINGEYKTFENELLQRKMITGTSGRMLVSFRNVYERKPS